jgi:hypothetical protein
MISSPWTPSVPGHGSARLHLPQAPEGAAIDRIERALCATLAMLRRDLQPARADAAEIEYASWLEQKHG